MFVRNRYNNNNDLYYPGAPPLSLVQCTCCRFIFSNTCTRGSIRTFIRFRSSTSLALVSNCGRRFTVLPRPLGAIVFDSESRRTLYVPIVHHYYLMVFTGSSCDRESVRAVSYCGSVGSRRNVSTSYFRVTRVFAIRGSLCSFVFCRPRNGHNKTVSTTFTYRVRIRVP